MAKKPWRTVQFGEDTGRFTREQIRDAVRAVKERNESKSKKGRPRKDSVQDAGRKGGAPSAPKPENSTAERAHPESEA